MGYFNREIKVNL